MNKLFRSAHCLACIMSVLSTVIAEDAQAQACPTSNQDPCYGEKCCAPGFNGNPVDMKRQSTFHRIRDFKVAAPGGDLEFLRTFRSDPTQSSNWGPLSTVLTGVPVPFGGTPTGDPFRWTHNLFSLVYDTQNTTYGVMVRDMGGGLAQFTDCGPLPGASCWALPHTDSPATWGRLKVINSSGGVRSFEYTQPNGVVLTMDKRYQTSGYYFLSKALNPSRTTWYQIDYHGAAEQVAGCTTMTATGIPYIKSVRLDPGGSATPSLAFAYREEVGNQFQKRCVIASISYHPVGGGADSILSTYSYLSDGGFGAAQLGSVSNLPDAGDLESYDYGPNDTIFKRTRQGAFVSQHNLGNLGSHGYTVLEAYNPGSYGRFFASTYVTQASSSGYTAPTSDWVTHLKKTYVPDHPNSCHRREQRIIARIDDITSTGHEESGSEGTETWQYEAMSGGSCSYFNPEVLRRHLDKRNNGELHSYTLGGPVGDQRPVLSTTTKGITGTSGTSGLETTNYTYVFDSSNAQLPATTSRASIVGGVGITAGTNLAYDGSRLKSSIVAGMTRNLAGTPDNRSIGTFYRTARTCDTTSPGSPDAHNRTLRVEGPCDVAAPNSSACTSATYPVTEFYYFDNASGLNSGRLQKVVAYPNGSSCGTGLTTQYSSYNAGGLPLTVIDPNGVTTTLTYEDRRITSSTTTINGSPRTTTYRYESGNLTRVTYPLGNFELFCYRTGANDDCTGGTLTNILRWKAKAYFAASVFTWTERVEYVQTNEGQRDDYRNASEIRSTRVVNRDTEQRPTSVGQGWGSQVGGSYATLSTKRRFDAANNQERIGPPFNGAPDFCSVSGAASTLCAWLTYDRADRLAGVDMHPDTSSPHTSPTWNSSRTCYEYDAHGNVKRISAGCSGGPGFQACPINNTGALQSGCSAYSTDYEYDDFGNVIKVTFPWTSEAGRAYTRYEYDAFGNMTKKQTAQMRNDGKNIKQTFDQLGRLLSVAREGGTAVTLYTLGYDNDESVESNCGGSLTLSNGRLSLRNDAFGKTWYRYDEAGRVVRETRLRATYFGWGCSGTTAEDRSPSTSYTYDGNGNLRGIIYPRGRAVEYSYSADDRPTTIKHSTWNGSAWNATWSTSSASWTGTPTTVITNIAWEPYGGLRGYKLSNSGKWVEYYQGGSLEIAPTATTCATLPATQTDPAPNTLNHDRSGRLRGVHVSDSSGGLGAPNGAIFKQVYTWNADMLTHQTTCFGGTGVPVTDTFGYDRTLRLTSAGTTAAASYSETYAYDGRGNRNSLVVAGPGCTVQNTAGGVAHQVDLLASSAWGTAYGTTCNTAAPAAGKYLYFYDRDGRQYQSADITGNYQVTGSYSQGALGAGLDSVLQSATISGGSYTGGTYTYFYDAFNRRISRTTPWNSMDEYFYDLGHQLLSDSGSNVIGSTATEFPEDDYIWLGGRPVVQIRNKFSTSWARQAESTTYCVRNGEPDRCSTNFLITDYLGKPVVILSDVTTTAGVAWSARYQAFGHAHRRAAHYASPHNGSATTTVMTINDYMPSGFDAYARVLFNKIVASHSSTQLGGTAVTSDGAHKWSPWVYRGSTGWDLVHQGSGGYGFDMEAYEVKIKQWGVHAFWTPLRFPGQYYDEETELHENWNRYYDPSTGRYLQPEPEVRDPNFLRGMAGQGRLIPTYAYAANNPIGVTDPNGLVPSPFGRGFWPPPSPPGVGGRKMRSGAADQCVREPEEPDRSCEQEVYNVYSKTILRSQGASAKFYVELQIFCDMVKECYPPPLQVPGPYALFCDGKMNTGL